MVQGILQGQFRFANSTHALDGRNRDAIPLLQLLMQIA
jgi:hypothetical protein